MLGIATRVAPSDSNARCTGSSNAGSKICRRATCENAVPAPKDSAHSAFSMSAKASARAAAPASSSGRSISVCRRCSEQRACTRRAPCPVEQRSSDGSDLSAASYSVSASSQRSCASSDTARCRCDSYARALSAASAGFEPAGAAPRLRRGSRASHRARAQPLRARLHQQSLSAHRRSQCSAHARQPGNRLGVLGIGRKRLLIVALARAISPAASALAASASNGRAASGL
jgi:hypothetical protein